MTLNNGYMPAPEIARRLGVGRNTVYSILSSRQGKATLETVRLGDRLYVGKDSFTRWLASQSRYKEQRHVSPPRIQLRKPKNTAYYTVEEVCRFYGMRSSMRSCKTAICPPSDPEEHGVSIGKNLMNY